MSEWCGPLTPPSPPQRVPLVDDVDRGERGQTGDRHLANAPLDLCLARSLTRGVHVSHDSRSVP